MGACLIYVIGASGSGKDSLINYARERLAGDPGAAFARRYITRPAATGGEDHVALTQEEFNARLDTGFFALHWESHGYSYGIGMDIEQSIARGVTVVVNGSREYLSEARLRFPSLVPVLVQVHDEVLRKRLTARGRDTPDQIGARLRRHARLTGDYPDCLKVDNNGPLEKGGEALISIILRHRADKGPG